MIWTLSTPVIYYGQHVMHSFELMILQLLRSP